MKIQYLSDDYDVQYVGFDRIHMVYELCRKQKTFYKYHPPFVSEQSILDDMQALPPNKTIKDKHYIGFFKGSELIAIMDMVEGYPDNDTVFIGFFMLDTAYEGKGIGSGIIHQSNAYFKRLGYKHVRLGVDQGNEKSHAFWLKNGFERVEASQYIIMEKEL